MTSPIINTIVDIEWKDRDDSELFDSGYEEGIVKAIDILNAVQQEPGSGDLPSSFTLPMVVATLRRVLEGKE